MWDRARGKVVGKFFEGPLSPDGRYAFTAGGMMLSILDIESGVTGREVPYSEGPHRNAFAPNGKSLAIGTLRNIVLWDIATGETLKVLTASGEERLLFSPDGRWLLADKEMIDLTTDATRPAPPGNCAFSPDGALLACARETRVLVQRTNEREPLFEIDPAADFRAAVVRVGSEVEFLGDEAAARGALVCHIGKRALPVEVCEERARSVGLLGRTIH